MGGICPCLRKDPENLESSGRHGNRPVTSQSQPSLTNSEADDRTPYVSFVTIRLYTYSTLIFSFRLLGSADYQKQTSQSGTASSYKTMNNNDPPNTMTNAVSPVSILEIDRDRNSEALGTFHVQIKFSQIDLQQYTFLFLFFY